MALVPHPNASNMAGWFMIPVTAVPNIDTNCSCEWCYGYNAGGMPGDAGGALWWSRSPTANANTTPNKQVGKVYFISSDPNRYPQSWEGNWGCQVSQGFGPYGSNKPQYGSMGGVAQSRAGHFPSVTHVDPPVGSIYRGGPAYLPTVAQKPTTASTGYNCKRCNQKNDFASANQPDGTYVCFNCR